MGKGILEVQLIDAKRLADTDVIGDIDPYVLIEYRTQERKSSVIRAGGGSNPVWNETFKFLVNYSGGNDSQQKLVLRIMDRDTFTADDFIGQASINVADLISLGSENGKVIDLHARKYSVVLADRTYCGEIRVAVKFIPKVVEENETEEELGGWKHSFHH